ncbi:transposase, MuDR, MULE transposase domain protein [Tanacetum coccineum]|uniref:Transposase, MuDR, MULE transposase domain protein n=1 Tax=Tanacetum coccineum TaxID=301880 RepID=A0ABQ5C8V1_9ASTR
MDIMNRLPVKSLLQFRAVSKQWKFSIDNFEFIRNYGVRESNSSKDELLKAYEQCRDISMDKRAMIENFLKIESELDYKMQSALFRKATKLEKQIRDKLVREVVQSNYVCVVPDAYAFRLLPLVLLSFQILGDEGSEDVQLESIEVPRESV